MTPPLATTQTVLLIRHAHAFKRMDWTEPDHLRPLTKKGRRQAEALARFLEPEPIDAVWSSPAIRCVRTVEPLARRLGIEVDVRHELMEGRMIRLPHEPRNLAICGHGDNIPELLDALGVICEECRKGSIWRLELAPDRTIAAARYIGPPEID